MVLNRVGIIGGGQLAWMLRDAATKLNIQLVVQSPNQNDPAISIANQVIVAPIADSFATKNMSQICDVITFENEFIDLPKLQNLESNGVKFYPRLNSLSPLLDKFDQRCFFQNINLPIPRFSLLENETDLHHDLGYPVVLKARRHGYDGYGTFIINNKQELTEIWHRYNSPSMLLEEFVPYQQELAIMAARNIQGEVICYPVVQTIQKDQVCRQVFVPAQIPDSLVKNVEAIAHTLLSKLEYVGVFGIELFLTEDNRVLVNEIAPRTHNSGHYTLDLCDISQFEMQLRAVTGLNLPEIKFKSSDAAMVNLLGYETSNSDYQEKRAQINAISNTYLHWYNKTESRKGRKLGHVTILGNSRQELEQKAAKIEAIWYQ